MTLFLVLVLPWLYAGMHSLFWMHFPVDVYKVIVYMELREQRA